MQNCQTAHLTLQLIGGLCGVEMDKLIPSSDLLGLNLCFKYSFSKAELQYERLFYQANKVNMPITWQILQRLQTSHKWNETDIEPTICYKIYVLPDYHKYLVND